MRSPYQKIFSSLSNRIRLIELHKSPDRMRNIDIARYFKVDHSSIHYQLIRFNRNPIKFFKFKKSDLIEMELSLPETPCNKEAVSIIKSQVAMKKKNEKNIFLYTETTYVNGEVREEKMNRGLLTYKDYLKKAGLKAPSYNESFDSKKKEDY